MATLLRHNLIQIDLKHSDVIVNAHPMIQPNARWIVVRYQTYTNSLLGLAVV